MDQFDGIIIGFGKAGKTLATDLANRGQKIAIIEKDPQMYGGTCINAACIPTKALYQSAKQAQVKSVVGFDEKALWYKHSISEKNRLIQSLRQKNYDKLNNHPNITIYDGVGSFISDSEVSVNGVERLTAPHIYINTGSSSNRMESLKDDPRVVDSAELIDLETLPKNLTIVGGGFIALEFATIYNNFGSNVTMLVDQETFLSNEDPEFSVEILKIFKNKGIKVVLDADLSSIEGDVILVAKGRRPNIDGLNLEKAGIKTTDRGAIEVNRSLQTSQPHIYAMGDVNGGRQHTYISLDDYRIVKSHLFRETEYDLISRHNVPSTVFMDPPYSKVGLSEQEANDANFEIEVVKVSASVIPKAHILKNPNGLLKAIIDKKTHRILGVNLLCEKSEEMINIVKLAMDADLPYTFLRDQVYTHPTMTESFNDLFNVKN